MITKVMLLIQIILCLTAAFIIMTAKHRTYNLKAGLLSSVWAGVMLMTAMDVYVSWPDPLRGASLIETILCGASAGLAWWSGGSAYQALRILGLKS